MTAVCAAAGIIVGVITQTGLGLNLADDHRRRSPRATSSLTTVLSAVAVLLLGLAVPVTASFIIAAVIIAPALIALGVSPAEAYMFVFYYAVLSEVSPPTALSAVAAAAITGGNTYRTMMMTWRYTLPAFLVPFAFVLTPNGQALLGQGPISTVLLMAAVSAVAVAALAMATGGLSGPAGAAARGGRPRCCCCSSNPSRSPPAAPCWRSRPPCISSEEGDGTQREADHHAIVAAAVLAPRAAAAGSGGGSGNRLSIATGGTTGVYYVYGGGLAKQLSAEHRQHPGHRLGHLGLRREHQAAGHRQGRHRLLAVRHRGRRGQRHRLLHRQAADQGASPASTTTTRTWWSRRASPPGRWPT